jgi:hypothetical protein
MIRAKTETADDVIRWMESESAALWPAILGSLSFRRSPCVRENCPAWLSGEQHPSHVLYGRHNGRRFAVYVPEDLVGEVRRCVDRLAKPHSVAACEPLLSGNEELTLVRRPWRGTHMRF